MTQSDTILEFIDGTLSPEGEQSLFDTLAHQPELRATLRQFIMMGEAVRADREAFAPPAHLERSLLGGLGLAGLAGEVLTGAAGGSGGVATGGWLARTLAAKGVWSTVTAFVAGAVLAGGAVFFGSRALDSSNDAGTTRVERRVSGDGIATSRQSPSSQGNPAEQAASAAPSVADAGASSDAPRLAPPAGSAGEGSRRSASGNRGSIVTPPATPRQANLADRSELQPPATQQPSAQQASAQQSAMQPSTVQQPALQQQPTAQQPTAQQPTAQQPVEQVAAPDSTPAEIAAIMPAHLRAGSTAVSTALGTDLLSMRAPLAGGEMFADLDEEREPVVALEVRKHQSWSLQQNRAREVHVPTFEKFLTEDVAFGGYVSLARNLRVGAEMGWDRYAQTLNRSAGDTLRIEQQPKFFWGGLALRYTGERMFEQLDLHPFLQATGGLTSVGPLLRTRLGAQWDLAGPLSWNLAIEASSMVYLTNGQRQLTGRFGVTMGVELGL